MKPTRGRAGWFTRLIWVGAVATAALLVPAVAFAAPTAPTVKDATVYQGGTGVVLSWAASTDTQAGAIQYQIYRDDVPMTIGNYLANGELVTTTSDTTVTVTPRADELTKKFTYYYMVVATNTSTANKAVSSNITPNVHGGLRSGYQTYNCQLCHSVHGAPPEEYLGAATRYKCYRCHGNTTGSTDYGDKAIRNVQRDFFDYESGQTVPTTVSRHYNAYMATNETECTTCHTPHKSPYYVDPATGVKLDASSYTQLLRAEISDGNYYYSTDAVPSGNTFCLQCHGASTTVLDFNAGAGTYDATSGDHTYAPGAVHNETVVYTNNDTHATNPGIQCLACHNKHASAVDKLVDYRGSGTSSTENNQAGLCFKCHRAGTSENRVAVGYAAPYAWNARDLYAQFAKAASGGSSHPTTAGGGRWTPDSGEVFSQDTDTEFASDTLSQTVVNTADGDGSVVLNTYTQPVDPPAESVVWAHEGGSTTFDEYTISSNAWNDWLNPDDHDGANGNTNFSPATGSSSFVLNSKLYTTVAGGASALFHEFNPTTDATGDWNQVGVTLNGNIGTGGDTAVGAGGVAYFLRGGGTSDIYWWNSGAGTEGGFTATTNGTTGLTLGQGAAMTYAPAAARLFVIHTNNGTGDEFLRWVANPGTTTATQTFATNNIAMVDAASWARMVYATSGASSTEYLFAITRQGGANKLIVISGLSGTPSATSVAVWPTGWGNLGDGCDLVWDGVNGGYLYATIGGNQSGYARIDIPDNPAVAGNWGTWQSLTQSVTGNWDATPWAIGSSIGVMPYDPPSYNTYPFYDSGTATTPDVTIPGARPTAWDEVTFTKNQPANTTLTVTVQGWNGSAWVDLTTSGTSPIDVSGYPVATYSKLRLRANLTTTAPSSATPRLDDWAVSASWENFESGSYVQSPFTAFSQPAPTAFLSPANNTLSNTVISASTVVLDQYTTTIDPPAQPVVWANEGGDQSFAEYTIGTGTWNDLLVPDEHAGANGNTNFTTASGSSSFVLDNKVYTTVGNASAVFHEFNPYTDATGDWNQVGVTLNGTLAVGGDTAVGAGGVVYFLRGGGNSNIYWWNSGAGTENGFTATTNGTTGLTLGQGSAMAYAPTAARLFVIHTSNGTGDEYLRWAANPGTATTNQTFATNNIIMVDAGSWARMVYATSGASNTEYLFAITRQGGANKLMVIRNLNGTPAATSVAVWPTGWGNLGDGCNLAWDGINGGYLYATIGGDQSGFARIDIPDDPTVAGNWGSWESLTEITAAPWDTTPWAIGSSIAVMPYDPPSQNTNYYYGSGTVTTAVDINPVADSTGWGTVSWTETLPASTDISVKVQGWNGSAWVDLTTSSTSPIDISSYSISTYTKLKLVGTLSTTAPLTSTPVLTGWTVTSTKPVWQARGSVTCVNCHNTHTVARGGATAWDMARVSDPDSTKDAYTGTATQFCLECHDESAPSTALNDADILVPYNVGFRTFDSATSPFWPGWNKKAAGVSFENSAHATTAIPLLVGDIGCQTCHDPHASDNARLTAYSYDQDGGAPVSHSGTVSRNNTSTYDEQNLCYACHDTQSGALCTGGACHPGADIRTLNAKTPIEQTYGHPVGYTDRHSDLEGASDFGPAATDRHAECVDCHDPHAAKAMTNPTNTSVVDGPLVGASGVKPTYLSAPPTGNWNPTPSYTGVTGQVFQTLNDAESYTAERMDGEADDFEAYVCFKCHSSYAIPTFTSSPYTVTLNRTTGTYTATDIAMEFNPSNYSYHNVLGQSITPAGSATSNLTTFSFVDNGGTTRTQNWYFPSDAYVFKTGYTRNTKITCTDCHTNETVGQAKGPHGSTGQWLIDPKYGNYRTASLVAGGDTDGDGISGTLTTAGSTPICAKCHDLYNAGWAHNGHDDDGGGTADAGSHDVQCVVCHVAIPHGWKRPRLLVNANTDPAPYRDAQALLVTTQSDTAHTWSGTAVSGWGKDDCGANSCSNTHSTSPGWQ